MSANTSMWIYPMNCGKISRLIFCRFNITMILQLECTFGDCSGEDGRFWIGSYSLLFYVLFPIYSLSQFEIMKKYFCSNHCRQRTLCAVPSRVLLCLKPAPMTYILKMATCSDYSTRLAVHYISYISERKTWFLSFSKKDLSSCTGTSPVIMLLWRSLPPRFCWYFQRIPDDKTYLNLCWKLHSSNFKLEDDVCRNILLTF